MRREWSFVLVVMVMLVVGCAGVTPAPVPTAAALPTGGAVPTVGAASGTTPGATAQANAGSGCALRLATTTSTADSGLLDAILPAFEKQYNCKVDVVAVGTGQALEIGRKGDADVVLVHARAQEDRFVKEGHARERFDVMYNDFVLVGPKADPAQTATAGSVVKAFQQIAAQGAAFASRGDKSGTNTKELSIWASAGITPTKESGWYNALGQGMGETLLTANEKGMYTLTDRGTYLSMTDKLPELAIVVGGKTLEENKDKSLLNPYGVMAVNPDKHPGVSFEMATNFCKWLLAPETQTAIGVFGKDKYGQALFYPGAPALQ